MFLTFMKPKVWNRQLIFTQIINNITFEQRSEIAYSYIEHVFYFWKQGGVEWSVSNELHNVGRIEDPNYNSENLK